MSESQIHDAINRGKYEAPDVVVAAGRGSVAPVPAARPPYPHTPRGDVVDHYHGEAVPDPYRWLEDAAGPQTAAWVAAQNELTESCLAAVPARDEIRARLAETWDYPRFGVPFERGGRWFCSRNRGLQNQPVFYVMDAPDGEGRALIDPNALAADGTVAVAAISVSPDGSQVAYATAVSGSDWLTWRVRDVASGEDFGAAIEWSKSAVAEWAKDGSGFYYGALAADDPEQCRWLRAYSPLHNARPASY